MVAELFDRFPRYRHAEKLRGEQIVGPVPQGLHQKLKT